MVRRTSREYWNRLRRLIAGFFKTWAKDLGLGILGVLGLIGAGFIEDIPRNSFYAYAADGVIVVYFVSSFILRRLFPESRWSLEYSKQFFRLAQWLLAVIIAILSPIVLTFTPFLTLAGVVPRVAIAIVIVVWLSMVGSLFSLSDEFKEGEDRMVARFQKAMATPNYDAIISSEEFDRQGVSKHPERADATQGRMTGVTIGLLPRIKWLWTNVKRLGWLLALLNIVTIGYGITNVYYASDMNSVSIYCVSANHPELPGGVDWGKIDITIGLNRTQSFLSGWAESIYTTWRITLLVSLPGQTWTYVNASTLPVNLGVATTINMTFDSTLFLPSWNLTVDSISVTNTYSSGNPLFPLEVVHVDSNRVNLDLPFNATTIVPRMLKLRQLLIQNILLLSELPVRTIPYGCETLVFPPSTF